MMQLTLFALLLAPLGAQAWDAYNYTQFVDHFSSSCHKTFRQRYYVDASNWRPGGPLLHFLGGESPIGSEQLPTLYPWAAQDLASGLGAMVLVTEHRYFGESLPFGPQASFDDSADSCEGGWGLLNVEQALRDFVDVAASVKSKHCPECPVIAVGGSYPGLLATMIRVRYPDAVASSIAASAPLGFLAGKNDLYGWFRKTTEGAAAADARCPDAVRSMFSAIRNASQAELLSEAGFCDEGLGEDLLRREAAALVRSEFGTLTMMNYPPTTSPMKAACGRILGSLSSDTTSGLRAVRAMLLETGATKAGSTAAPRCISVREQLPAGEGGSIDCIDRTGCGGGRAGQAWDYMGCTWLRIGIATNNVTDMFPPLDFSESWVSSYCGQRFKAQPQTSLLPTRFEFSHPGQLAAVTSHIIFTNGLRDGWSVGGILQSPSTQLPAIVMPNGAHHSELGAPRADDTADVVLARATILAQLQTWLAERSASSQWQPEVLYGVPPVSLTQAVPTVPTAAAFSPPSSTTAALGLLLVASMAAAAFLAPRSAARAREAGLGAGRHPLLQSSTSPAAQLGFVTP